MTGRVWGAVELAATSAIATSPATRTTPRQPAAMLDELLAILCAHQCSNHGEDYNGQRAGVKSGKGSLCSLLVPVPVIEFSGIMNSLHQSELSPVSGRSDVRQPTVSVAFLAKLHLSDPASQPI